MFSPSLESPILILTGPPGAGKTTTAEVLAKRTARAVHLEADSFFGFVRSGYVEPWKAESREQNQVVMRIVADAACGYAGAGYFTIVDGIVMPDWYLAPLREAFAEAGFPVAYAVLRAPLSVCTERLGEREGGSLVDPMVIERLWQDFADLGHLERHVLEVAEGGADEVADLLARRLADGSLMV